MRLIDTVFRQGHLSERALVDALVSGARPGHLDRCDICAERATQLARWMDELQADATELADAVFTPERLAAQQHQILRRLEQLDHPARVISFPAATRPEPHVFSGRRVAVSWVGVAAAAGLIIGIVGGQVSARLGHQAAPTAMTAGTDPASVPAETPTGPVNTTVFTQSYDSLDIRELAVVDDLTPRFQVMQVSARGGR